MSGLDANKREEYLVGCQALVECGDLERTEVYAGDKVAQGSFGWLVPVGGSMALAGAVSRNNPGPRFKTWLEQLQLSGKVRTVETQTQNWGIPIRPLPKTYGDRVLAVGDSAGLVKPLTGGGIYYALRSGAFAAETLHEAMTTGDFSPRGLQDYERRWKDLLAKELRVGYYGRLIYETLDDDQIEKLMAEFLSEDVLSKLLDADDFSFDWHSRVIARALRIRNLSTMLRSFGPVVSSVLSRMW
jgi:flavin-dependent dehydrogenase